MHTQAVIRVRVSPAHVAGQGGEDNGAGVAQTGANLGQLITAMDALQLYVKRLGDSATREFRGV